MLPALAGLLGAGASIAGAFMGGNAQNAATMWNWAANERNRRDANKERQEARALTEEIRKEQKLGGYDAMGNRSYFDEDKGWVVELSPDSAQLIDYFFKQELPARREQFARKDAASYRSDDLSRAMEGEFRRTNKQDPQELENLFYYLASRGIKESTDDALQTVGRDSLRKGSSNFGRDAAAITREAMDARADARMKSFAESQDYVEDKYNNQRSNAASLMQMFRSMSDSDLGASYDPSNEKAQGNQLLQLMQGSIAQGNGLAANAVNKTGGRYDYNEPALGTANALGATGNVIAGVGERIGASMNKNDMQNQLMKYLQQNETMKLSSGGIFGNMNERLRKGVGGF